ncbi:ABC transporter substrate-binding protein [Campylobacter sp. MG1]|uniref:ABC transporter substrate-binding protein n=1 Tax=Campylobacter sp. MG1 TaxID=2976332 RepID=UPI00226CDF63|nr:ABC transporter substrate-binding protein [Campylobacter sp. MG1]
MKKMFLLSSLIAFNMLYANPNYGGTLVFARTSDASLLDPAHVTDAESIYATRQIYDTLVRFKKGSTEIEPALAKSYEISEDGLTYIFHLREGVYFAPTKYFNEKVEMTADDVVFSLKRQFDENNPYHSITGSYDYWVSMGMNDVVKDVEKIDNYTVKITLKKNEAPFLANMAMDFMSIVSKKYADKLLSENKATDLNRYPVGTGPFVFVSWKKDDAIVLQANKNYWDDKKPYLDRLIIKVVPNASVRAAELKAGQIHIMDKPNFTELENLAKIENIKIEKKPGVNVYYMSMNMTKEWFKNPLVRQAINHAINKEAIIKTVYEDYARVAYSPVPISMWGFNENIKKYEYNPKKAKELLIKAGYPDGFSINLLSRPSQDSKKAAEAIQADLAKVGINVKIQNYDFTTYLKIIKNLEHDMSMNGWQGDNGDPDNFLYIMLSKNAIIKPAGNFSAWSNDEFDALITKAKEISNQKEREELYKKAQEIFGEESPWVTLANIYDIYPMQKNIEGFEVNNIGGLRFDTVWIKK